VHNNYYFLRQVSKSLGAVVTDTVISECFSQQKEELIVRFETHTVSFYIKASVLPSFSTLSFPENFQRARKNSVDLFEKIIGRRVKGIRQFANERSFALELSDEFSILFKMHGNRANIVILEKGEVVNLFKNSLEADSTIRYNSLDREIDWSFEAFQKNQHQLPSLYFTFGKLIWRYLDENGFHSQTPEQKYEAIQHLRTSLENPPFYITTLDSSIRLSLVKIGEIRETIADPMKACNEFYYTFSHTTALLHEKNEVVSTLRTKLAGSKSFYKKNLDKLGELKHNNNYKEWADLIMANLHQISTGTEQITVENFYNENLPVDIRLKRTLSPQKNAEVYYRKSKNQQMEIDRLQQLISAKETEIGKLEKKLREAEESSDLKEMKKLSAEFSTGEGSKNQAAILPYHEFLVNGFRIWVGRNAQSNDILTLKLGYKEDLWLHAKDVAGSHVLIKHQAGKIFPKDVIERAAQLAAYNSKRKNESLCPVIVTPKKFVRKRKGDPAGAVIVEREDVIMVEPKL
jgi:predicted ribosome quality control (RQC) complex YloA/Tae2 family protein